MNGSIVQPRDYSYDAFHRISANCTAIIAWAKHPNPKAHKLQSPSNINMIRKNRCCCAQIPRTFSVLCGYTMHSQLVNVMYALRTGEPSKECRRRGGSEGGGVWLPQSVRRAQFPTKYTRIYFTYAFRRERERERYGWKPSEKSDATSLRLSQIFWQAAMAKCEQKNRNYLFLLDIIVT